MTTLDELRPLFTEVTMSRDEANAIVAALRDVAHSDGVHDEELSMIDGFIQTLDADLGETEPTELEAMTPARLALKLIDPTLRTVAIQCAVLLALADGGISEKERQRVVEYASALGIGDEQYRKIESVLSAWMKSGDLEPLMA
jgi:tellurite resistance protein